jgi:hypothetical protein
VVASCRESWFAAFACWFEIGVKLMVAAVVLAAAYIAFQVATNLWAYVLVRSVGAHSADDRVAVALAWPAQEAELVDDVRLEPNRLPGRLTPAP